jgi:hypothetical protein
MGHRKLILKKCQIIGSNFATFDFEQPACKTYILHFMKIAGMSVIVLARKLGCTPT